MKKLLTALILMLVPLWVKATEIVVWDKTPIDIRLEVGKERLIHFPSNVMLALTPELNRSIRKYNISGTLYLTPKSAFPKQRIQVQLDSGERMLINLFSTEASEEALEPMKVIHQKDVKKTEKIYGLEPESKKGKTVKQIVQYAHIDLFGVPRLKPNIHVTETDIKVPLNLDLLFGGRSAGVFQLSPIKQYRTQYYTVTAILVQNRTSKVREVLYTDLYPSMIAASVHNLLLGPKGTLYDKTIMFVITKKPLSEYAVYSKVARGSNSE